MKKLIAGLLIVAAFAAYAQPKPNIITVNSVRPKKGQKMAFEAAYKVHIAKFHATGDKTNVYEVMSGPSAGYYHLIGPAETYADFDKDRSDASAHSLDLDKTFFPYLDETRNGVYQMIDSCGIRPNTVTDAYVVAVRHLNEDLNVQDYRRELARAAKIRTAQKSPFWEAFSSNYYEQLWDGSDQVTVTTRNLKDGFKSLAPNYYPADPAGGPSFRDEYVKLYGHAAWDDRVKLLETAVTSTSQYIMRLRRDMSSK
jgi:hypothetical protein